MSTPTAPPPSQAATTSLSEEQIDDLLFAARVGDLDDVKAALEPAAADGSIGSLLAAIRNESGNTLLHYAAANGHLEIVRYLLPHSPLSYLLHQNESGNTPLHWAGLNGHLVLVQALIERIESAERASPEEAGKLNLLLHVQPDGESKPEEGSERRLWDVRNAAGRGPMSEAQMNEREDVVKFLLERMVEGPAPEAEAATSQDDVEEEQGKGDDEVDALQGQTEKLAVQH